MRQGETRYLLGGRFYRLAWTAWGDRAAPCVICVHGLTRNGRDFDVLAQALSDRFHVVCPDLPGRGRSEWLAEPSLYQPMSYVQALSHLLAELGGEVAWLGTSLGGICGMVVASMQGNPVSRLLLNDIGRFIPRAALARIGDYIGTVPARFADLAAVERYLRQVHAPFGKLTDAQWRHLALHSARALPDDGLALHYDPAIAVPILATAPADQDLSAWWSAVAAPRMIIRGADSDLLDAATFAAMAEDGVQTLEIEGAGHAPALMDSASIAAVRRFLSA